MVVAETEARAGFEHPAVVAVEGIVEAVPVVAGGRGHGGIFEEVVVVGVLAVDVEGVAAEELEFEAVVVHGLELEVEGEAEKEGVAVAAGLCEGAVDGIAAKEVARIGSHEAVCPLLESVSHIFKKLRVGGV